jgi:hypothetical protein
MGVFKSVPKSGTLGIRPVATLAVAPAAHLGARKTRIWERITPVRGPPWSYFDRWESAGEMVFDCPDVFGRVSLDFTGFCWIIMDVVDF